MRETAHIFQARGSTMDWITRCGRSRGNKVVSAMPAEATCISCLKSALSHAIWKTKHYSEQAFDAKSRLDTLQNKRARRKVRKVTA